MSQKSKQDLRFIKNENLIRKTFREMIAETEYRKISIKELTQRAQINRKTFYLHYSSLDQLLSELQIELMSPTLEDIAKTNFPDDVEEIIQHSFHFMSSLDSVDKKYFPVKGIFRTRRVLPISSGNIFSKNMTVCRNITGSRVI